jgi:hypothetical protein
MPMQMSLKSAENIIGEKNRAAHALWRRVTANRTAPRREEITLGMVRGLTPWLWVIDVVNDGTDFRFRLIGDRIVQFFGTSFTGMRVSELEDSPFSQRTKFLLTQCLLHKTPLAVGPMISGYANKNHWEVEAVVLPLSGNGQIVDCLMGMQEFWPTGTHGTQAEGNVTLSV